VIERGGGGEGGRVIERGGHDKTKKTAVLMCSAVRYANHAAIRRVTSRSWTASWRECACAASAPQ
jgi:hypothetical protein